MKKNQSIINFMKKMVLLIIILPGITLSNTVSIKQIDNKYKVNFLIKNYTYTINKKNNIDNSFSVLKNGCNLELNNSFPPNLMKDKNKDFEFTFLHEISHCILGQNVFYEPIDWKIEISLQEKEKIKNIILENENFYLQNKKTPLIKVIYHEIFADTLATMLYFRENENGEKDIRNLLENRIIQNQNPYDTHLSVTAIKELLNEQKTIKNLTIEKLKDKAIRVAQENLLQYIRVEYE